MSSSEVVVLKEASFRYPTVGVYERTLKDFVINRMRGKTHPCAIHRPQLNNISMTICRGERVGLVGRNASGKSTLLKLIAGIAKPDSGICSIKGTVTPLMDIGVGMNNELSVIENIKLALSFQGIPRREIPELVESVVHWGEFSALLDKAVGHLSSGTRARLAFATSTALLREIVLIDEIISVGDIHFEEKAKSRLAEASVLGSTVITVSHNLDYLSQSVDRIIWLENGSIRQDGGVKDMMQSYRQSYLP